MKKSDKYKDIFLEVFGVNDSDLNDSFTFKDIDAWTSLTHMCLIAELEDTFGIMFDPEDILHYGSYENGKSILQKHGVNLDEEV